MHRCLYCYKPLNEGEVDFHPSCAMRFFGVKKAPLFDYSLEQIDELASKVIAEQTSLTGVQPKLSLHLQSHQGSARLTIVGLWGRYICKPETSLYPMLPEVEDLTMHLAELAHIEVVPHSLMHMADGSLCYLSRRIDRTAKGQKIAMEDLCQLTERQTEYKYKSSYEKMAKTIESFSSVPRMDVTNFFEVVLFSWIVGNNDMHLKNFSLYEPSEGEIRLTPAYDLLNVAIVNPADREELALSLNGKKSNLKKEDFLIAGETMGIENSVVEHLIRKYLGLEDKMSEIIDVSFLSSKYKIAFRSLISSRMERLK